MGCGASVGTGSFDTMSQRMGCFLIPWLPGLREDLGGSLSSGAERSEAVHPGRNLLASTAATSFLAPNKFRVPVAF